MCAANAQDIQGTAQRTQRRTPNCLFGLCGTPRLVRRSPQWTQQVLNWSTVDQLDVVLLTVLLSGSAGGTFGGNAELAFRLA
jgi:hypothetical protein